MSLINLLAATRSIKTAKDEPSPYRMKQRILLPKFGPKADTDYFGDETGEKTSPLSGIAESAQQSKPEGVESIVKKSNRLSGWAAFRGKIWRRSHKGQPLVQTELSLETVQVVRNDLQECSAVQDAGRKQVRPKETSPVAGQWWARLQGRMFARSRKQR